MEQDRILYTDFKASEVEKKKLRQELSVYSESACKQGSPLSAHMPPSGGLLQITPPCRRWQSPLLTIFLWEPADTHCMKGKIMRQAVPRNPEHDC